MGKRYPACLHLPTALPWVLFASVMLTRDVAMCSCGTSSPAKVPSVGGHGVLGARVVRNASLLAWLLGEGTSPCGWMVVRAHQTHFLW